MPMAIYLYGYILGGISWYMMGYSIGRHKKYHDRRKTNVKRK